MSEPIPAGLLRTAEGIYVLAEDSHLSRWVEERKRLDIAEGEIDKVRDFIPHGGVVVDAGASLGDHAATYSKLVGEKGRVFAFEPNPLPFEALSLNMRAYPNVFYSQAALSDRSEIAILNRNLCAGMAYIGERTDDCVPVPTVRLDDHLGEMDRFDFWHLDVEGHELKALNGGINALKKHRPVVYFEVNKMCLDRAGETEQGLRDFFAALEYRWVEIDAPHLEQRDCLALPPKRV